MTSSNRNIYIFFFIKILKLSMKTFSPNKDLINDKKNSISENASLQYSELKEIIDTLPIGYYRINMDGEIIFTNKFFSTLLSFTYPEDIMGKNLFELQKSEEIDRKKQIEEIIKNNSTNDYINIEWNCVSKDSTLSDKTILETIRIERDSSANFLYCEGIIMDITQRKLAIEEFKRSEERFRSIFENSVIGMYRTSPEGKILMANKALIDMLGYSSLEDLQKRNLEEEGYEPNYFREKFKKDIETNGKIIGMNSAWKRKDGSIVYVRESAVALKDSRENITLYEGTVEDITQLTIAIEELRKSETKLREAVITKDKFFSIIAHDLKNPISGFLGLTEYLCKNFSSLTIKEINEITSALYVSSNNLNKLLENLLEWSRTQTGRIVLNPGSIDIYYVITNVLNVLRNQLEWKNIRVINNIQPHTYCYGDSKTIETVMRNIISNAIKFSYKNSYIEISSIFQNTNIII